MNKVVLSTFVLATLGLLGVGLMTAMPFGITPEEDAGFRDAVHEAISAGDYDAWRELMLEQFDETHFEEMQAHFAAQDAIHDAIEAGDYELAKQLREEAGFPERGRGRGHGMMGQGLGDCPFADED